MKADYILTASEKDNLHQLQRKVFDTIVKISSEIKCWKITTNTQIATGLADCYDYEAIPHTVETTYNQQYKVGKMCDVEVYVDQNMRWNDTLVLWSNGHILEIIFNDTQII